MCSGPIKIHGFKRTKISFPLNESEFFLCYLSLHNVNIKLDSLQAHLETISLSLSYRYERTLSNSGTLTVNETQRISVTDTTKLFYEVQQYSHYVVHQPGLDAQGHYYVHDNKVKIWTLASGDRPLILSSTQVTYFTGLEYHYVVHSWVCLSVCLFPGVPYVHTSTCLNSFAWEPRFLPDLLASGWFTFD